MLLLTTLACAWLTPGDLADRLDMDGDGTPWPEDCDDGDRRIHPGTDELCDGVDNDCDGFVDEAEALDVQTWYRDADGDGYASSSSPFTGCAAPDGYIDMTVRADCDDHDAANHPGADERCDTEDNDCDRQVDEDAVDAPTWYRDADGDGYGDAGDTREGCEAPNGYVALAEDCDDTLPLVNPDAREICNDGLDNDCDGAPNGCRLDGSLNLSDLLGPVVALGGQREAPTLLIDYNADGALDLLLGSPLFQSRQQGAVHGVLGPLSVGAFGTGGLKMLGNTAMDQAFAGASLLVVDDLDGDGSDELLVGAPGGRGLAVGTGAALLVLGSNIRPEALSAPDATLAGSVAGDEAGTSLALAGDINQDRIQDILVGAPGADLPQSEAGTACAFSGASRGVRTLTNALGCVRGVAGGDRLGAAVTSVGPPDGDGRRFVALGAPFHQGTGAVFLVNGMRTTFANASTYPKLVGDSAGEEAGAALADAGDLDADGLAELIIGAPGSDRGGTDAGVVYVVDGAELGAVSSSARASDVSLARLTGETAGGRAGAAVRGAGDLDGDGHPDLAIGAPEVDSSGEYGVGRVYVLYGPISGDRDLSNADLVILGTGDGLVLGTALGGGGPLPGHFDRGDLDGDGLPDLLVSAPGHEAGGRDVGAVFILPGTGF